MSDSTITPRTFQLQAIGTVQQSGDTFQVVIDAPYRPALKQLEHFSHVIVFWWADQGDTPEYRQFLQAEPPYAPGVTTGVFATRSPLRPNPVAITTCAILGVDEEAGIVRIGWIDAFDGTPVVDLKAYFPTSDRVKEPRIPDWLTGWPEWLPDGDEDWSPDWASAEE